ncbi:MAG: heavy-metal-associated domain-containing protein [Gemmatimonadota bacterium]
MRNAKLKERVTMKMRSLWKLTGLGAVATVAAAGPSPAAAQQAPGEDGTPAVEPELASAQIVLRVDGMSCPFCAYGLEKRLKEIPAVDTLLIRLSDGIVQIRLEEGATLGDEELARAVKRAGFSLREVRRTEE